MAEITKPILLDETGKQIVEALQNLSNVTTTIDFTEASKQQVIAEIETYLDTKLSEVEQTLSEV